MPSRAGLAGRIFAHAGRAYYLSDRPARASEMYEEAAERRLIHGDVVRAAGDFIIAAVNFPHVTFGTDTIVVSEAGDMALDIGSVTYRPPGADMDIRGKYVVVWVRRDGEWKVLADIFNTNGPPEEGG